MRGLGLTLVATGFALVAMACAAGVRQAEPGRPAATPVPTTIATPAQAQPVPVPSVSPEPTFGAVIQEALPFGEPLEEEVTAAYREYWRVYSDALYSLDASQLPQVASGQELERLYTRVRELTEQGEAIRVNVDHITNVLRDSGTGADIAVRDKYTDRSFALDAKTKEPLPARDAAADGEVQIARGRQQDRVYFLKRTDDTWKVVQAFQVSS